MFYECYKLKSLEISNFNTKNVKSMTAMFVKCSTVTSIYLTEFDISLVTNALHIFEDCHILRFIKFCYVVESSLHIIGLNKVSSII